MMNASSLDYTAFIVRQDQTKTPAKLDDYILVPQGASLEIWWQYSVPVNSIFIESTPQTSWQAFHRTSSNQWAQISSFSSINVRTKALKLVPSNGCMTKINVTLKSSEITVNPEEITISDMTGPVNVTVQSQVPGAIVGWIDGPGWHVAVEAVDFIPIYQAVSEGWIAIDTSDQLLTLSPDPTPQLPYAVNEDVYAYGPVYVFDNTLTILASDDRDLKIATVELGILPIRNGTTFLPLSISTAWILSAVPNDIKVWLRAIRYARTSGVWKDGFLTATSKLPACVVADENFMGYTLVVIQPVQ